MMTGDTHRQEHLVTLVLVLGIATAYYVTGRLGLLLALPPGYATPVWPPAGIALGAILLGGYRGWPGVLLGSWLVNMGVSVEATGRVALLDAVPLVGAFGLAIAVFVYTSGQEQERLQLTLERQAENLAQTLEGHLDRHVEVLRSIARLYASVPDVDREAFRSFVSGALAHYAGMQALSWDRRVPDALRETYEEAVRREGYPDFQITERDPRGQMVRAARRPE